MPRRSMLHCLAVDRVWSCSPRATRRPAPAFVYSLTQVNGGANQIYGFRLDSVTGALTALPGFPVATGGNGSSSTVAEQLAYGGGRLFAVNDGSNTLSVFVVNQATGALTALPFSPIALGSGIWMPWASIRPARRSSSGTQLPSVARELRHHADHRDGGGRQPVRDGAGASPFSIAFSRDGNFVYTGGNSGNRDRRLQRRGEHRRPHAVARIAVRLGQLCSPCAYATDSAGRLFVANRPLSEVRVFTTSAGVPTGVRAIRFRPDSLVSAPARRPPPGRVLPGGGQLSSQVGVYQISGSGSGTTLSAVGGSPFASGAPWRPARWR